jgi:hypothetical protein
MSEYDVKLTELKKLILMGLSHSTQADALRDEMDEIWMRENFQKKSTEYKK